MLTARDNEKLQHRRKFERLFVEWRRAIAEYTDPDTPEARLSEIEDEGGPWDREMMLAWQVVTYPIDVQCLLENKFEVIAHYAGHASHIDPLTRVVFAGLASLRIDCLAIED